MSSVAVKIMKTQRPRKLSPQTKRNRATESRGRNIGKTIVPLRIYFKEALIKCEVSVGTGKNQRDKRQDLKKKVASREAEQALKKLMLDDRDHFIPTRDSSKYWKYWKNLFIFRLPTTPNSPSWI